ncbi:hypothetical protein [Peptoniphilus harei]|uniref:hypothetical protein n=1 Tax=Peptoniphilus harei TaxID=54005 RepID=UPI0011DDE286|nr:hypothetical protein [Peptoniphilus harei]
MNYLKKIYLNWFTLGLTLGIIPYVIELMTNAKSIKLIYLLYIFIPVLTLKALRLMFKEV